MTKEFNPFFPHRKNQWFLQWALRNWCTGVRDRVEVISQVKHAVATSRHLRIVFEVWINVFVAGARSFLTIILQWKLYIYKNIGRWTILRIFFFLEWIGTNVKSPKPLQGLPLFCEQNIWICWKTQKDN